MDLNVRADVNFVRVDVNCEIIILLQMFFILILMNTKWDTNDPCKISASYQAILEKKLISFVLLFLALTAILDSRPD